MSFNEFELVETGDERDDTEPTVIEQTDEKPPVIEQADEEPKVASHAAAVEIGEKSKPELEEQPKLELDEKPKPGKSSNESPSVVTTPKEVKEHRKSRSKHHGDRSEKSSSSGSTPAVQFEITSRGVRVISEKESFL